MILLLCVLNWGRRKVGEKKKKDGEERENGNGKK
jgi:hypothetical protein